MVETRHQSALHREAAQSHHHKLSDIFNDKNFELIGHHKTHRGDMSLLFKNKQTGDKLSFPNVNPDHIPKDYMPDEKDLHMSLHHGHYSYDMIRNNSDFTQVTSHENVRGNFTKVFKNEKTGERITFANVKEE